jgi:hypothetical protein
MDGFARDPHRDVIDGLWDLDAAALAAIAGVLAREGVALLGAGPAIAFVALDKLAQA